MILTVVPVQPRTCTVAPFYAKSSSRMVAALMTNWHPDSVSCWYHKTSHIRIPHCIDIWTNGRTNG